MNEFEQPSKIDRYLLERLVLGIMAVEKAVATLFEDESSWAIPSREFIDTVIKHPSSQQVEYDGYDLRNLARRRQQDAWIRSFSLDPDYVFRQKRFKQEFEAGVTKLTMPKH